MKRRLLCIIALVIMIISVGGPSPGFAEEDEDSINEAPLDFTQKAYTLGGFPRATTLADVDSDGDLDVVVTNPERHNITVLLNRGDGTFDIGKDYPVEGYPISIISTDIDSDSDNDLAVLDSDGKVRTFFNDGDGSFSPGSAYPIEGYSFSITPLDVEDDGDVDLIVLSANVHTILLNDGKGGFDSILAYPGGANSPTKITVDLNADTRNDLVIGDKEGVSVLLNNGDDTFASGKGYATGKMPVAAAMGDLNFDEEADLVVANYIGHTVSILRSNGDGTFQEAINYPSGKGPNSITTGDIDGDEDMDIIVTNGLSGDVTVFINKTGRPLAVVTDALPQGRKGAFYETRLEAKGGVPPYTWAVVSGSPPPSIHLDPETGEIYSLSEHEGGGDEAEVRSKKQEVREGEGGGDESGEDKGELLQSIDPPCFCLKAPTGLYRFTVQVKDSASSSATADLHIEVLPQYGTISGKIKYSGEKTGAVRIGLWAQAQSVGMGFFQKSLYSTGIPASGEYRIEMVYPAAYHIAAHLDVNGDGVRQPDEPFGTFMPDGPEGAPGAIEVKDNGEEVTGIDIEMKDGM